MCAQLNERQSFVVAIIDVNDVALAVALVHCALMHNLVGLKALFMRSCKLYQGSGDLHAEVL